MNNHNILLDYNIIYCNNRNLNSDKNKGIIFISDNYPKYPIEIGIEFKDAARVDSIDILVDQYKVPSKFDISVDDIASWSHVYEYSDFNVLGEIKFDEPQIVMGTTDLVNKKQLRHVKIRSKASKIRLRFYKPAPHSKNTMDQIVILALKFKGTYIEPMSASRDVITVINNNNNSSPEENVLSNFINNSAHVKEDYSNSNNNSYNNTNNNNMNDNDTNIDLTAFVSNPNTTLQTTENLSLEDDNAEDVWGTTNVDSILRHLGLPVEIDEVAATDINLFENNNNNNNKNKNNDSTSNNNSDWKIQLKDYEKQLRERKSNCLKHEFFEEAQRLKTALTQIASTARTLEKLDKKKQYQIMTENFDEASIIKEEMQKCLEGAQRIFHALTVYDPKTLSSDHILNVQYDQANIIRDVMLNHENDNINDDDDLDDLLPAPLLEADSTIANMTDIATLKSLGISINDLRRKPSTWLPSENDINDTLDSDLLSSNNSKQNISDMKPEELSAHDYANSEPLFEVFSEYVMMCFHSKQWMLREYAIKQINERLKKLSNEKDSQIRCNHLKAFSYIIRTGCQDNNAQNFLNIMELFKNVLNTYNDIKINRKDIINNWNVVATNNVSKLGHGQQKIRMASNEMLLALAKHSSYNHQNIIKIMFKKLPNSRNWKLLLGYLQLLNELICEFGVEENNNNTNKSSKRHALPIKPIMDFICETLQNPHSYVRSASISVYSTISQQAPEYAESQVSSLRSNILDMLRSTPKLSVPTHLNQLNLVSNDEINNNSNDHINSMNLHDNNTKANDDIIINNDNDDESKSVNSNTNTASKPNSPDMNTRKLQLPLSPSPQLRSESPVSDISDSTNPFTRLSLTKSANGEYDDDAVSLMWSMV